MVSYAHQRCDVSKRKLTELEKQFMKEGDKGCFGVAIDDDGFPFAMGARHTQNLFSMEVEEIDDPYNKGSIYRLPLQTSGHSDA